MKKSQIASLLLTILFGPLGLLYSSIVSAVVVIGLSVLFMPILGVLLAAPLWLFSIAWGALAVASYNSRIVKHEAQLISKIQSAQNGEAVVDEKLTWLHYAILSVATLLVGFVAVSVISQ